MTRIDFRRSKTTLSVDVMGHSDYGNGGPDIVCSACSMLILTLIEYMRQAKEAGELIVLETFSSPGSAHLCAFFDKARSAELNAAVDVIALGFRMLSEQYPNHVAYSG